MFKIKKEKFIANESLGWKLIYLSLFVIGGTGYAFYIVSTSDVPNTPALAQITKTKLVYEIYLIAIICAMGYLFMMGLYILLERTKPDKSSSTTN